jgi:hypothetical protein
MSTPLRPPRPCSWLQTTPGRVHPDTTFRSERKKPLRVPADDSPRAGLQASAPPLDRRERLTAWRRCIIEAEQFISHETRQTESEAIFQAPRRLQFDSKQTNSIRTASSMEMPASYARKDSPHSVAPRRASLEATEVYGSRVLLTPVRASPAQRRQLGSDLVLSPVRVSSRRASRTPVSRNAGMHSDSMSTVALLTATNWAYSPNDAIALRLGSSPFEDAAAPRVSTGQWRGTPVPAHTPVNKKSASPRPFHKVPVCCVSPQGDMSMPSIRNTINEHDQTIQAHSPEKQLRGLSSYVESKIGRRPAYVADCDAVTFQETPEQMPYPVCTSGSDPVVMDLFLANSSKRAWTCSPSTNTLISSQSAPL